MTLKSPRLDLSLEVEKLVFLIFRMPFDTETGSAALLNILGANLKSTGYKEEGEEANAMSSALGGMPLALKQVGRLIVLRGIPLERCFASYNKISFSVDAKSTMSMNRSHTLATDWETALSQLSGFSKVLLIILSFLHSDYIHQSILKDGALQMNNPTLEFMMNATEYAPRLLSQLTFTRLKKIPRYPRGATLRRSCSQVKRDWNHSYAPAGPMYSHPSNEYSRSKEDGFPYSSYPHGEFPEYK